jgi:hypothetical protein
MSATTAGSEPSSDTRSAITRLHFKSRIRLRLNLAHKLHINIRTPTLNNLRLQRQILHEMLNESRHLGVELRFNRRLDLRRRLSRDLELDRRLRLLELRLRRLELGLRSSRFGFYGGRCEFYCEILEGNRVIVGGARRRRRLNRRHRLGFRKRLAPAAPQGAPGRHGELGRTRLIDRDGEFVVRREIKLWCRQFFRIVGPGTSPRPASPPRTPRPLLRLFETRLELRLLRCGNGFER